ncbi:nuclear pore complex subunit Nup85 protein [Rutstroemia sp. NJR-2017a WRK4]|nr:nuclear pore complex subunit Nup85 protein [Rutstroemia sp. NJR-2017a WRK4]
MPGYQYSSSPPSTPSRSTNNAFSFATSTNASTTPAGLPPSSVGSFTPAGPAPSSFGSSMLSPTPNKSFSYSQQSAYDDEPELQSPSFSSPVFSRPAARAQKRPAYGNASRQPQRSLRSPSFESEEEELEEEDNTQSSRRFDDMYSSGTGEDEMDEDGQYEDEEMDDYRSDSRGTKSKRGKFGHSNSEYTGATSSNFRQSKGNQLVDFRDSLARSQSEKSKPSDFSRIAKDLANAIGIPEVDEGHDLVLKTESIIAKLYDEGVVKSENEQTLQRALATIPSELTEFWKDFDERTANYNNEEYTAVIGPGPGASDFSKANYLAHLALQIHHSKPVQKGFETITRPLPQIMLEWLDEYHDPFPNQLEEISANRPSPSAHHLFWNTIHNNLLRGKVVAAVNCLKSAGWKYAWAGTEEINDQGGQRGYEGAALANVEKVADDAISVLSLCPAVKGDWNVRGTDWTLFRLRISQALEDLKTFAEGGNRKEITFGMESFSGSTSNLGRSGNYSKLAKKAASQVPWNIYQNMLTLYGIVLGDSVAIVENAQDWCEATIALLVWRDENKDNKRLAPGRSISSLRASTSDHEADTDLRRLRRAFHAASGHHTDFQVNSMDPVEVGLACLFEGDAEAVITIVRSWSLTVASALAEVASLAGWLPRAEPQALLNMGLDAEAMDVLGAFGTSQPDSVKDVTLISYANGLFKLGLVTAVVGQNEVKREGWELAIAVLGRLDSTDRSEQIVEDLIEKITLDTAGVVDRLWKLLNDLGMSNKAETIAMNYANSLARDTQRYGEALWYYALAHNIPKVKDVLDTLMTFCLVYSTAYPPESALDDHLQRLLSSPASALEEMSGMDLDAANLVHTSLSGYATLRKFYTLRDEQLQLSAGQKPSLGPIARKTEAANALLALIISADDKIRGGLYDEDREAVVPVEYILALLGEAMPFVNQPDFLLKTPHIDVLLRAIEDIQGVGPRIYSGCSDFLDAVIASKAGLKGAGPMDLLRQQSSEGGLGGSFSMAGSSMVASQLQRGLQESGLLSKGEIKRGWDWRERVRVGMGAEEVLRVLRLGLARDLARAWLRQADGGL